MDDHIIDRLSAEYVPPLATGTLSSMYRASALLRLAIFSATGCCAHVAGGRTEAVHWYGLAAVFENAAVTIRRCDRPREIYLATIVVGILSHASWVMAIIDGVSMMPTLPHVNMA